MSRLQRWVKFSLLPPVGAALPCAIAATMRRETRGYEEIDALYGSGGHIILAFWHAQQLMIPVGYRGTGAHVLISQHGAHPPPRLQFMLATAEGGVAGAMDTVQN